MQPSCGLVASRACEVMQHTLQQLWHYPERRPTDRRVCETLQAAHVLSVFTEACNDTVIAASCASQRLLFVGFDTLAVKAAARQFAEPVD